MNKNLKKVISAVAALAISASAVSAFAVNFPDVAEDASYAQAVQELSALDIISGFDDGTFRPDDLVTRAQITKMIVDALNHRAMAEASRINSQFNDVSADHWAKGYINQGVADKFIAGYSDTEFGPDDNVTYVQAQKMLVSAIGYETYAQGQGGWPNGYKQYASQLGITDGISGLNDDTQLTRAQVAQLIDNAMDVPICVIDGYDPQWNGTELPILKIRNEHDGDDAKNYQTMFIYAHDAYKVYGRVTKTSRSESNSSLDADEVEFNVEKAENFDDLYVRSKDDPEVITANVGDTNAADYLRTYAEALIQKDSNDEWTFLSITAAASSSNKAVTVAAEDIDDTKSYKNPTKLYFYTNGKSTTSYKLDMTDANFKVYVNGTDYTDKVGTFDDLVKYIADHDTASVTLQKQTKNGSTSTTGDYTLVTISTYETAVVNEVNEKSADKIYINLGDKAASIDTSRWEVDLDDENVTYSFKLDGVEIEPSAIQEDDVLSISFDQVAGFKASEYYDVIVSRDVLEGAKCSSVKGSGTSSDPYEYTIDGTSYKAANGFETAIDGAIEASSTTYTVYLDHFGRIAKVEEDATTKNLAILKNVYKKRGGDWVAQIITQTGAEEEHNVKTEDVAKLQAVLKGTVTSAEDGVEYDDTTNVKSVLYPQQVFEYKLSSSDNISVKKTLKTDTDKEGITNYVSDGKIDEIKEAEYKTSTDKIGKIEVSENSVILDLSDINKDKISVKTVSSLKDGVNYAGVGYDRTTSGDEYDRFIILTKGGDTFGYNSQLAIVRGTSTVTDDGEELTALSLFVDDDETKLTVDDEATLTGLSDEKDLKEGDIIVYVTDANDYITDIQLITSTVDQFSHYTDFADFQSDVAKNQLVPVYGGGKQDWTKIFTDKDSESVDIIFGAVVNRKNNKVTIAPVTTDGKASYDGAKSVAINYEGAKIYAYDFGGTTKNGNTKISANYGIAYTPKVDAATDKSTGETILDLTDEEVADNVVYAIARVDDTKALEIVLLLNEDN